MAQTKISPPQIDLVLLAAAMPSGTPIVVKDEGSNITTSVTQFDFVGAGVTAGASGGNVTITIPGGAGTPTSIVNGTSNVVAALNSNVTIGVAGNATIATFTGTGANISGTLNATGNANTGNIGATGGYFTTVGGSLTTNAQGNITSVGTLSSLAVTGNTTTGNLLGSHANGNSNINIPSANGNVNISAIGNANILVVTGTGVNVAGTFNSSGNANALNIGATGGYFTTVGGSLTTAAQPNITSVGTLSSLTVTANSNAGAFYGAATGLTSIPGANVTGTVPSANVSNYDTITTASSGNYYVMMGNVITGNVAQVGNAAILANTSTGILYATKFSGDGGLLSNISSSAATFIANGTSNVSIATNANVTISVAGNANIATFTGTGANIAGTANISGNANVGNIGATGFYGAATGLTSIPGANVTGTVALANVATYDSITTASSGNYYVMMGNVITGNVAQVGNAAILANTSTGILYATKFSGDGSLLTGVGGSVVNYSTGAQASIAATRVYVTGSNLLPTSAFRAGSMMRWVIGLSKTAASTAAPVIDIAFGTTSSTSDTARVSWTAQVQTAVLDTAVLEIDCYVQVYSGASSVVAGTFALTSAASPTTGFKTQGKSVISGTFDLTTASTRAGICLTGGASSVWTVNSCYAIFTY